MTTIRILLYTHCLIESALVALTAFALDRRRANDWRFDRQLNLFLANPIGACLVLALVTTWFYPPACLAVMSRGRMSQWRRWVLVVEDTMLGLVQAAAILLLICARP
jgi:hypothetical protein